MTYSIIDVFLLWNMSINIFFMKCLMLCKGLIKRISTLAKKKNTGFQVTPKGYYIICRLHILNQWVSSIEFVRNRKNLYVIYVLTLRGKWIRIQFRFTLSPHLDNYILPLSFQFDSLHCSHYHLSIGSFYAAGKLELL